MILTVISHADARATAKELGFTRVKGEYYKGQEVFKKGTKYISADADQHKGGYWKLLDKHKNRIATYDKKLIERKGD